MRRRELITLLGGAAAVSCVSWPFAAWAQRPAGRVPRIGFLHPNDNENVGAFIQGLRDAGYVDGRNALVETRIYGTMLDRLAEIVDDLIALKCDIIFAAGPYAIEAATRSTSAIPIVGVDLESDPVASGWAKSLGRPGGNVTGFFLDLPELGGKQIELLREAVPTLSSLAVLWDSTVGLVQFRATEAAAHAAGVALLSLPIRRPEDLNDAFARAGRERLHGMIVLSSPIILGQRSQIADLALETRLPTISLFTLFPKSGTLMAYGPNLPEMHKRAGTYVDRILKGTKAGDLPIERPTKFELVVNLKTARALGVVIPESFLVRADEVIE
jgi:putative tryptophan/tyrosine transport system substrate-binding protein